MDPESRREKSRFGYRAMLAPSCVECRLYHAWRSTHAPGILCESCCVNVVRMRDVCVCVCAQRKCRGSQRHSHCSAGRFRHQALCRLLFDHTQGGERVVSGSASFVGRELVIPAAAFEGNVTSFSGAVQCFSKSNAACLSRRGVEGARCIQRVSRPVVPLCPGGCSHCAASLPWPLSAS